MSKLPTNIKPLVCLPLTLMLFSPVYAEPKASDARIERVRKDLGYYQGNSAENPADLSSEIHALREELRQTRELFDKRLQDIENTLLVSAGKSTPAPIAPAPAPPEPSKPSPRAAAVPKSEGVLTVCSKACDFSDLQKAVEAAMPGSEIDVAPEINGSCAIINKTLHLVGKKGPDGQRAHLAGGVCNGKAPLVTAAGNIVIEGFEISSVAVGDGNGACIRVDPGTHDLTVKDIHCHDSQDGILGKSEGNFIIEDSSFIANGFDNGQSHGLYVEGDNVLIRRCQILSTQNAGHSLKSGAKKLTVEDSIIAALNAHNSRALDIYSGGEVVLTRNVIHQGPQSDNSDVIGLALEASRLHPDHHSLKMENNWVIFDEPGRGLLIRGKHLGPVVIRNNNFVGLKGMGMDNAEDINNNWYKSREQAGLPEFDGKLSSLPAVGSANKK